MLPEDCDDSREEGYAAGVAAASGAVSVPTLSDLFTGGSIENMRLVLSKSQGTATSGVVEWKSLPALLYIKICIFTITAVDDDDHIRNFSFSTVVQPCSVPETSKKLVQSGGVTFPSSLPTGDDEYALGSFSLSFSWDGVHYSPTYVPTPGNALEGSLTVRG